MLELSFILFFVIWIYALNSQKDYPITTTIGLTLVTGYILYDTINLLSKSFVVIKRIQKESEEPSKIKLITPVDNIPGDDPIDVVPSKFSVGLQIFAQVLFALFILYGMIVVYRIKFSTQSKEKINYINK